MVWHSIRPTTVSTGYVRLDVPTSYRMSGVPPTAFQNSAHYSDRPRGAICGHNQATRKGNAAFEQSLQAPGIAQELLPPPVRRVETSESRRGMRRCNFVATGDRIAAVNLRTGPCVHLA